MLPLDVGLQGHFSSIPLPSKPFQQHDHDFVTGLLEIPHIPNRSFHSANSLTAKLGDFHPAKVFPLQHHSNCYSTQQESIHPHFFNPFALHFSRLPVSSPSFIHHSILPFCLSEFLCPAAPSKLFVYLSIIEEPNSIC